jgi:DNA-binding Lrp family transcriptional regulator
MPKSMTDFGNGDRPHVVLALLETVERDATISQRRLAAELGIALGLVNAYLKRCLKQGLLKLRAAPARRYAYYLTSKGFAEKSLLTVKYLTYSSPFFQRVKTDCLAVFRFAGARGYRRIVLMGVSDLAEIAIICALETDIEIVALVDPIAPSGRIGKVPVVQSFDRIAGEFDAVIVSDLKSTGSTLGAAIARFGTERVLAPSLIDPRVTGAFDDHRSAA